MGDSNKVSARTFTDVVSSDGGGNKMWENCVFIVLIGSRVQCAPLSIEDANMTAFFFLSPSLSHSLSFVVTWSSALLDGKILDLVCSGDSTQPSKVIQEGFFEGRLSLYPATLSATHFLYVSIGDPTETCSESFMTFWSGVLIECCLCRVSSALFSVVLHWKANDMLSFSCFAYQCNCS